jgi:muconate cycloisomerase
LSYQLLRMTDTSIAPGTAAGLRIVGCEIFIVRLPTRREHTWASNTRLPIGRHALLRIDTAEGLSGWGEAPAIPTWGGAGGKHYGETPETVSHIVQDYLLPAIEGADPLHIASIHRAMNAVVKGHPYAKAMVDMACYDLAGKALGVPVWALLGGKHRDGIQVTHSLGIMDVDRCVEEAQQAVAEGIGTIKCKTGLDGDRDVELVRRLRETLGDAVQIRVDGNEGYASARDAIGVLRRQEQYRLLLCEQPVVGVDALAEVQAATDVPVMADESAWTPLDILELHDKRAAACFSCYVTKPGGLYHARQQAEIAARLGIYCDIGGSVEMGVGNAANLHLGVATANAWLPSVCPVTRVRDDDRRTVGGIYYLDDIVTESFAFEDGRVLVPDGPGLGVEVDMEKVAAYAA